MWGNFSSHHTDSVAQVLWSEDRYASLWCGFSLIKPNSGWPPVWFSLCQACGTATRVGETTCSSLPPWTSSLGQKMACAVGTLLCNPQPRYSPYQWWLLFPEFPLFLLNVMEILKMSLLDVFQQLFLRRYCSNTELTAAGVPWGTPEALFGPRSGSWFRCHSSEIKPGMPHKRLKTTETGGGEAARVLRSFSPHIYKRIRV